MNTVELTILAERGTNPGGFDEKSGGFRLDQCFHELFEDQVARTPDRIALVFKNQRLTYKELNQQANRLAFHLRTFGVQPNHAVGLFLERSADMIIALLGILKAGGAYVPLHPDLPKARLADQLAVTEARILVTSKILGDRIPEYNGHLVFVDRDKARIARQPSANPGRIAAPSDLIYLIFTSGSTGTPKGVATRHENVVNYTHFILRRLGLLSPDNSEGLHFANVSTLSADLGNTPIFAALASGGCLHMIEDDVLLDGHLYAEQASHEPIDILKIAPSHLRALMASGNPEKILPRRYLVIGGESLHWDFVRQIKKAGSCAIINHYSPTETTIGCLTFEVDENSPLSATTAVVPLGKPITNMTVYVLDSNLRQVADGIAGDLYIGGAGVSNGYIRQPELTAARFLLDPLNPASGRRFYRSGDRARLLPGGIVEFLGREDDQVKIRGFRVELGEIENVLTRHPAVQQAALVLTEDPNGNSTLTAFLIADTNLSQSELREYLTRYLPDYMVPSSFVRMASLPLSSNGKVDRQELAKTVRSSPKEGHPIPFTAAQEKMTGIWSELLGTSNIGLHDNFFDLGGHSLLATQIIARVRTAFDAPVPLRCIFEAPTIAGLTELVAGYQPDGQREEDVERILREVEGLSDEEARKLLETEK